MEPSAGGDMVREARARREPTPLLEDEADARWTLAHLALEVREAEGAAAEARARLQRASEALHRQRARRSTASARGLRAELADWARSR